MNSCSIKLSAFADEVSDVLQEQISFLRRENLRFIELRLVDGANVVHLALDQIRQVKQVLVDNGIRLSALGSPIGKVRLDEPFDEHFEFFKRAVEIAQELETRFIRVFSYYPPEGKEIDSCRNEVLDRMAAKLEWISQTDLVLAHENESGIYGHKAANCRDLAESLGSDQFKLVFDPANFVWGEKITDCMDSCWPAMEPYVAHIHVKDWSLGGTLGRLPGEGDGQIPQLLNKLKEIGYSGFLTLEPHLAVGGQFGGHTGPEPFSQAVSTLRSLMQNAGLNEGH